MDRRHIKLIVSFIFVFTICIAQWNAYQPFQPHNRNYLSRSGGTPEVELPQQDNIIFQHNIYDGNTTAQVGSYAYTRSGSAHAWSASNTLTEYAANALPISARWNGAETMKGAAIYGATNNYLTYSEAFNNAVWTAVGTGSASAGAIMGSAEGDGIAQDSATAAASNRFVFSVFLTSKIGTGTVRLILKDEGTQWAFVDCPITTTERRCSVPHAFTSGTGDVQVQILVGNSTTVLARGAQLEQYTSGTGRHFQYATPSLYVKTTSAPASSSTGNYLIPNAIASQAATTGSISFWHLTELDWSDKDGSTSAYFLSANLDLISATVTNQQLYFFINNGIVASTPAGLLTSAMQGPQVDRWTHWTFTWDADANVARIYINGVEVAEGTGAFSPVAFAGADLGIGSYSNAGTPVGFYSSEASFGQIIMWDVALTAQEVADAYQNKRSIAERSAPGTGLIFSVDLGTSPVPTVGDPEHYWGMTLDNPYYYYDSPTTAKALALGDYPIGGSLNGVDVQGWAFSSKMRNYILQSEAPATTWTQVGTPTAVTNDIATFGDISLGIITVDAANEGIEQSVAETVASKEYVGSVYVKTSSGTVNGALIIEGDSGGTPETTTKAFAATTTIQRVSVHKAFSGSATGNIKLKITVTDASGSILVGGMMLERANTTSPAGNFQKVGSPYIKTTTTAASSGHTQIHYRGSDSFNPLKGTLTSWAFLTPALDAGSTEMIVANGPSIIGAPGQYTNFYYHFGNGNSNAFEYGGLQNAAEGASTMNAGQWYHLAITWDKATETYAVYANGVLIEQGAVASTYALTYRKFIIGGDYLYAPMDYWQGSIKTVNIYGEAKDAAFIDADFDATKAAYGY